MGEGAPCLLVPGGEGRQASRAHRSGGGYGAGTGRRLTAPGRGRTQIHRSALLEHPAERIFDIIEAAEHYPAFLPWCTAATITERDEAIVAADIAVTWRGIRIEFTTRNPKRRPEWLAVRLQRGPFRKLDGEWRIKALAPGACRVDFSLDCEPDGLLARAVVGLVLERVADQLMEAYVARADAVFGATAGPQRG